MPVVRHSGVRHTIKGEYDEDVNSYHNYALRDAQLGTRWLRVWMVRLRQLRILKETGMGGCGIRRESQNLKRVTSIELKTSLISLIV